MSGDTLTTAEVRVGYVVHTSQVQPFDEVPAIADRFDQWLAQHDAGVREQVAREIEARGSRSSYEDAYEVTDAYLTAASIARGQA
jgi:hypothetical protein